MPFDADVLGRALLDVTRAVQRLLQRRVAAHARANGGRGIAQQLVGGEVGQNLVGEPQRLIRRIRLVVPESDIVAGAREADRPGATDQSQSDEGDLAHFRSPARGERIPCAFNLKGASMPARSDGGWSVGGPALSRPSLSRRFG